MTNMFNHPLIKARLAVIGLFFVAGLALGIWVVNIPDIQQQTGISKGVLGGLLLLLGAGAFIGMQVAGFLVDRLGSKAVGVLGVGLVALTVTLPGFASTDIQLGAALAVFGFSTGFIDIAMNDQAVIAERAYGRPVMSSFHAFFSIGNAVGALIGAATQFAGLSAAWSLGIGAMTCLILGSAVIPSLLPRTFEKESIVTPSSANPEGDSRAKVRRVLLLAILAFVLTLAEGTANDWSALHAVDVLDQSNAVASFAYFAFAVAMTIGRFSADRVVKAFGSVFVVRWGSVAAAIGMLIVVFSPWFVAAMVGWTVFGIGLSGIIPQIFTAAGNLGGNNQGVIMSRVVGAGYLGLLAGPAIIGWVADWIGLNWSLLIPVVCCAFGVVYAGIVRPRRDPHPVP